MKRVLLKGTIIDGNCMATSVLDRLRAIVAAKPVDIPPPKMTILLAGGNLASESYVRKKLQTADRVGIEHSLIRFESSEMSRMLLCMNQLNRDSNCDGCIVQLPLPSEYCQRTLLDAVALDKDVDCLHTENLRKVELLGEQANILPCTSQAILHTLDTYDIDVKGKHTVVVGKSLLVGLPIAMLLAARGAIVKSFDRHSKECLHEAASQADVIVSAAGEPRFIKSAPANSIIFDVGYSRIPGSNDITGDIDIEKIKEFQLYTPVPGGIGPLTVAMLMKNVVKAWQRHHKLP